MMVYGGICCETWECFLVLVEERSKNMLLPIMEEHILPWTCIMSNIWKAYDCLQEEGYVHLTVNHSLSFMDPDTGALHRKSKARGGQ